MNLIQLQIRPDKLIRFAAAQGLARSEDEDLGYACHAWLRAMLGAHAPKPFRVFDATRSRGSRLLAYSAQSKDALLDHAQTFAEPLAREVLEPDGLAAAPMPDCWTPERRLGFEVLTCPTSRKDDTEKDIYQRYREASGEDADKDRAAVYMEWLSRQISSAAELSAARLESFQRVKMLRRSVAPSGGRRLVALERPQALITGELFLKDTEAFAKLVERGIGRHRAFGYGMLLLRPPR